MRKNRHECPAMPAAAPRFSGWGLRWICVVGLLLFCSDAAFADFFSIRRIRLHERPPRDDVGVWQVAENKQTKEREVVFRPCIEVEVGVEKQARSSGMLARAYFFDRQGNLLATAEKPSVYGRPGRSGGPNSQAMPVIFPDRGWVRIFFEVPDKVLGQVRDCSVLVVFGDADGVAASTFPHNATSPQFLDFPEKEVFLNPKVGRNDRREAMDPLIEHVVRTRNPRHPQITLFVRPPPGMTDGSEAKGVLAICVLANSVDHMRRMMQAVEDNNELKGLFAFAEKHKLCILAWGSRSIWNPGRNWDDYDRDEARRLEESFNQVADAWERGINQLHDKYGIPNRNFFMTGSSGAAQWAHRLALRKPDYFLAVHVHIPSSFDKPTPEASKVLWCLTTGERESGYERSLNFLRACRELHFPIIYKAIMGLGHSGHHLADQLRDQFFEYAMTVRDRRAEHDEIRQAAAGRRGPEPLEAPWLEEFANPPFVGDVVNQQMYPAEEVDMVPPGFRIDLPNKKIADIWARN